MTQDLAAKHADAILRAIFHPGRADWVMTGPDRPAILAAVTAAMEEGKQAGRMEVLNKSVSKDWYEQQEALAREVFAQDQETISSLRTENSKLETMIRHESALTNERDT